MKALLPLLAFLLCLNVHAAPIDDVKAAMDEPMILSYSGRREGSASIARQDYEELAALTKSSVPELQQIRGVKMSLRQFFALVGTTQGVTTRQQSLMRHMTATNAALIREKLGTSLAAANLTAAAADIEAALKSVETTKTLDRSTQDRFSRLAKVAQ